MTFIEYRAFSYGVTATNARKRRPLVFQTNPVRVKLFSSVNAFLCSIEKSVTLLWKKKRKKNGKRNKKVATWDLAREIVLNLYKIVLTSLDFIPLMCSLEHDDTKLGFPLTAPAVIANTLARICGDDKSRVNKRGTKKMLHKAPEYCIPPVTWQKAVSGWW